jgi:hypothetical protein
MRGSPTTKRWKALLKQRDLAAQNVLRLQAAFAPIEAELASIKSRLVLLEGMCATEKDKVVAASLRTAVDRLAEQAARRERVTGAARTLAGHALNVIADTDAALASLLLTSEGSESPLFRAARYERLDSQVTKNRITHVLYVNLDALAADTVTRRSILGTSGRLRFLSSGNASWLLLKTSTGTIRAGGQVSLADVMTFGLEQGTAQFTTTGGGLKTTEKFDDDPLSKLESWSKRIIVALVVVLLVVGVLSAVSVAAALLAALN